MDFRNYSFPGVPLIKTIPPGPKSKEYLDYQFSHEDSAVSYPRGMPMALRREVRTFFHRHGLLIEIGGHYSNVARFLPPYPYRRIGEERY